MIISRTPLRVSFFGGGTDFPEHFSRYGGAVLGTAIDKFVYHSVMSFPSILFDYNLRIAYSKVECVDHVSSIQHAPFREIMRYMGVESDVEINVSADLPSFSGLGSSSSFTVGLQKALSAYKCHNIQRKKLAQNAIHIERDILNEAVGCQDQVFAAYGGFNRIDFKGNQEFQVEKVKLSNSRLEELSASLLLFFTGVKRRSQDIEKRKIENISDHANSLKSMRKMVDQAHQILTGSESLDKFGELLHQAWYKKKTLDDNVSSLEVDRIYEKALCSGAIGGKLLGAGGGGFMLFFVPPERHNSVKKALKNYSQIRFMMNAPGSSVVFS